MRRAERMIKEPDLEAPLAFEDIHLVFQDVIQLESYALPEK